MEEMIQYLIRFLIQSEVPDEVCRSVGYTSEEKLFDSYKVVIFPSTFFSDGIYGTVASMPLLPLARMEDIPILYGQPLIEQRKTTFVVHADWIASAFFLLTRYEELLRPEVKDEHGRFPGKESLPYRAGFIQQPVVDLYGQMLRRILRKAGFTINEPEKRIRQIYLTHDVDAPFKYRTWRNILRAIVKEKKLKQPLKVKMGKLETDPYYTFPRLFSSYHSFIRTKDPVPCRCILFFRAGGKTLQDKPHYSLENKDVRQLIDLCGEQEIEIGLHASYEAGENRSLIDAEKNHLSRITGKTIRWNRHHFLRSIHPEDMQALLEAGITDDFTLGYADVAGFRLGTCRPVRWIHPATRRLTSLLLHPLTVMDCTLEESKYMGLTYTEAQAYCLHLIEQAESVGGEISLLWHNTSLEEGKESYLDDLYTFLLTELKEK